MALIARDLMVGNPALAAAGYGEEAHGHNAICAGFQGQRQWTDFYPNGDFMEAILNTSFDWNGMRAPYVVATENDALNGITMLFGHLLTNTSQMFADLRTYWSPEAVERVSGVRLDRRRRRWRSPPDQLRTGHARRHGPPDGQRQTGDEALVGNHQGRCAGVPESHDVAPLDHGILPRWRLVEPLFDQGWHARHDGANQSGQGPRPGPAAGRRGHGRTAHRRSTTSSTCAPIPRGRPRGSPLGSPAKGVFRDVYSVMNSWGANHCVMSYGHIGADLITLAAMLRIPVYMHNVPGEDLFRPSAWNAFGTADPEGADFRACAAYGPLYG